MPGKRILQATSGESGPDSPREAGALRRLGLPAVLLAALGAVIALCWVLYTVEAGRIAEQQRQRETLRVGLLTQLMRSELKPVVDTARLLADGDGLRSFLDSGTDAGLQAAVRRAQFVSADHPEYDQVRFIDQRGREVVRVNQGGQVVAQGLLQDVADHPWFVEGMKLPRGGLHVSAFDLNVERGQVETPLKPTLRFAVPVFDADGERRGVYVINYLGANLIAALQDAIPAYGNRLRLLNADGSWLKADEASHEWGISLPDRAQHALSRTDPELWGRVQSAGAGQAQAGEKLFTWLRIEPRDYTGVVSGTLTSGEPWLVMAAEVSGPEWRALFAGLRQILYVVAPMLTLLALLSVLLFRARRRSALELRSVNQVLEQRVRERTAEVARSYEELQDRESLLEETGQLAKVGGWEFDPVTGAGTWTPEIARIHDLDPTLQPSKDLGLEFYPGESRARIEEALKRSLEDGTPYDLELEFVSSRGVRKWVRTISRPVVQDGKVVRMRGALQDVTERKNTELRVSLQLQRLSMLERITRAIGERQDLPSILQVVIRTLEEQMPLDFGCICLYDPTDRTLTVSAIGIASSPVAEQLSMRENQQIPIDSNGLSRCVQGTLVYEPDVAALDFPFPQRLASGGLRSLVAAPLQVEDMVFGVLIAARRAPSAFSSSDCEFLKQLSEHVALAAHNAQLHGALQGAYEDLHATQQAVMQQERLRVLGQMASGIAHDINNAISPIMLYTDSLLETEPGLSDRARQSLLTIQQAVSDVAETVARMREFYRQREAQGELQPVQMNTLVAQLRDLTRARWETMPQQQGIVIDLQLDLAPRLPPVRGVESEIREALINLVFNATDAMPSGGILTIRTRQKDAATVYVEVVDTGVGMDAETRRRCLEPFFTTKGERGTGLGLAMVYGVMQRHNGEVEIESTKGRGTTMRLSFVVAEERDATGVHAIPPQPEALNILLVDDDPILLRSLRETLEIDGHTIQTANGGQEGINAFRQSQTSGATRFPVVITDLGMPHVDGRAVASAVKRLSPQTIVVMLTGWGERLLAEGHVVPHVDRVLSKPPRLRDLRQALAELTGTNRNA